MNCLRWFVLAACAASAAWSVAVAVWIARTPIWHEGLVQGAVIVPVALCGLATWSAWRRRRLGVLTSALLVAGFTFITGFSIGNAYIPAAGLLLLATLVAALPGFGRRE